MVNVEAFTFNLAILLPWLVPLPTVTFPLIVTEPLLILRELVPPDEGLLIVTLPLTLNAALLMVKDAALPCGILIEAQLLLVFMV